MQSQTKSITYYALDVSPVELNHSLKKLTTTFASGSQIKCYGLLGTYEDGLAWLLKQSGCAVSALTILWLGNSIGNLSHEAAVSLLRKLSLVSPDVELQFVIGADSCRDLEQIRRSYDPTAKLTQEFLLNGLKHANRVTGSACFSEENWECNGLYDMTEKAWKQHYVAKTDMILCLGSLSFRFVKGEQVLVIRSAKRREDDMKEISKAARLYLATTWKTAANDYGAVLCLRSLPDFVH